MGTVSAHRNRLAQATSPYLLQHAGNPVDWYPWGPEAFAQARQRDVPILLSVGYSACHWCHVMAHESFEDEATAALMNAHFVNVKLDREERPDVDQLYQGVVQLMGRGGGWPLTVFLTPDLKPFFGGTYFPSQPRHGLPAFSELLQRVAEAWRTERADLETQAGSFERGLAEYAAHGLEGQRTTPQARDIGEAASSLARRLDPRHGGFGTRGPKFPNPMNVALLLRGARRLKDEGLRRDALFTLRRMALGGLFDQLGGGFHRYSVDERWLVPHFEKMLYDNAQLLHLYAEAMQVAPEPLWRQVATLTVGWLERELATQEGAFAAAMDADSEGEEGKYFVWRPEEVDALLPPAQAALVKARFHIVEGGNFEHGATVLEVAQDLPTLARQAGLEEAAVEALLEEARRTLLAARLERVPPQRDDKVLTGWNGLMVRGLALAGRVFGEPGWVALARRTADFVLATLRRPDGTLWRCFAGGPALEGQLEDFGHLAAGLVALYQASGEPRYLEAAESLAGLAVERFWDAEKQAYLAAPRGTDDLLVPTYATFDNAVPSGASTLTEAQVALTALTGRAHHLEQAGRYVATVRAAALDNPFGFGHLLLAMDALLDGAAEVTLVGPPRSTAPLKEAFDRAHHPTVALHVFDPTAPVPEVARAVLAGRPAGEGVRAYLCQHFACQAPVETAAALEEALRRAGL